MAAEQLGERYGIPISAETVRGWLLAKGVTPFQRREGPHRAGRERQAPVGELVPLDGSLPDWLEGRGSRCVLRADLNDASRRGYTRFYADKGTIPAMDRCTRDVTRYGIPLALDADKQTTEQSPAPPTVDEPLAGGKPTSQFGRALDELGSS